MSLHIAGWALLAWFAIGLARALLPVASEMDRARRIAPLRSSQRYFYIVVAAVLDAAGAISIAVALYALVGFTHAAWFSLR